MAEPSPVRYNLRPSNPASREPTVASANYKTIDNTLFVGNLPYSTSADDLRSLFGGNGRKVSSAKIISNYKSGRSRGFGFVQMETVDDADAALELDGHELDGRRISVGRGKHKTLRRR